MEWYWVDATGWCGDINDIIVAFSSPAQASVSQGDGALTILATAISADGLQVGVRLMGGTPGVTYAIAIVLVGSRGADVLALNIILQCSGPSPVPPAASPWLSDFSNPDNTAAYYYL